MIQETRFFSLYEKNKKIIKNIATRNFVEVPW